ncbi:hypothetical protein CU669_04350 [Paramagnetospirillum kuznetsovii]|uniref:Uncharacterized protein n=1 Tax=Paramagnetospirillum kuznetsovii TaxID=2053833 RepID=A0A364P1Z9_9PROT|nr:hypothetical protein [Paramagnetospirillum kuznetsovii]RAU23368.1 hypothetical protein CU669_04350 [Paramagnetospirillum kuznetsovii]
MAQLSVLSPEQVYDHVLNTPAVLHECFQVFRSQPDLFKRVAVRPDKRPATSDQDPLWCGRTVSDVVRLIVRASAKRYFRATLPPAPRPVAPKAPDLSLLQQAAIRLRLKKPPPPLRPLPPPLGPAEKLYGAFRENLGFEWQVPLIPHYAPLDLPTVKGLGARILTFREPGQLKILAEEGLTADGRLPLMLDDASRLRGPDGGVDPNALSEAFAKMDLSVVFPNLADSGARRAVSQISCMDSRIFQQLVPALDNNLRLVTVFLFSSFARMGEKAFRQAMGPTGAQWAVQKLAKHLETCKPWPRSLPSLRQASERAMAFAIDLDNGLPAQASLKPAAKPAAAPAAPGPARAARAPTVAVSAPSRR